MTAVAQPASWVPLGPEQSREIWSLIQTIEKHDGTACRTSQAEVDSYFDSAYLWRASGVRTVFGELIAYGLSRMPRLHGDSVEIIMSGGVHPDYRSIGLGAGLVETQLATSEQLAQGEVRRATATMHVDSESADLMDLLERAGFVNTSSYIQMRRKLDDFVPNIEIPGFISIVELSSLTDDDIRRAHNEIYFELAGQGPMSPEQWTAERAFLMREWSFAALDRRGDRPRLAGYILSAKYDQEWADIGWSEGYIDEVAVHKEWRRMNLMTALLSSAMVAYRNDGVEYAGIDVSIDPQADNPFDRVRLFSDFEFEKTVQTFVMSRPIDLQPTAIQS